MRGYKAPPTDPGLWAKDAAELGLSPSEIEYNLFESRHEGRTNRGGGCGYSIRVVNNCQDLGNPDQYWIAEPASGGRRYESSASATKEEPDPVFGLRDQKFVRAFKKVAEEMRFPVAQTTAKLLIKIDMNRFDRKMPMTKAVRAALTTYSKFPEWFAND
jgi:hypothetical protein